jgi:hypothetical protein
MKAGWLNAILMLDSYSLYHKKKRAACFFAAKKELVSFFVDTAGVVPE